MLNAVETVGLCKQFPSRGFGFSWVQRSLDAPVIRALDDVSLRVRTGEVFGLVGPNGAGKTTLINVLATLLLPEEGDAYVGGYSVKVEPAKVRRVIAGATNVAGLPFSDDLSLLDQLHVVATLYGLDKSTAKVRIRKLVTNLGLKPLLERQPWALSSGMGRRFRIAKALLPDRPIIMLDEPFQNLDIMSRGDVAFLLKDMVKDEQKTLLLVSHDFKEVAMICDRVGIMNQGKIVKVGSLDELRGFTTRQMILEVKFGTQISQSFISQVSDCGEVIANAGPEKDALTILLNDCGGLDTVMDAIKRTRSQLIELKYRQLMLEEVFRKVLAGC